MQPMFLVDRGSSREILKTFVSGLILRLDPPVRYYSTYYLCFSPAISGGLRNTLLLFSPPFFEPRNARNSVPPVPSACGARILTRLIVIVKDIGLGTLETS